MPPGAHFARLSVVFPMWNEEAYIGRAVSAAHEAGEQLVERGEVGDWEVVVVDDASTDFTGALADQLAASDPRVRVVHHDVNRRLGGSLKSGFSAATGDLVLYTDADLPFDMGELVKACRLLRLYEADVVSAYRLDRTGEGPRRAVYSWAYNWLFRLTFGVPLRDVNFAFKLCRRRVLEAVEVHSDGSFVDAELLVRAWRSGFKVIQFGVDYFPRTRGTSTLSSPSVIGGILRDLIRMAPELRRIQPLDGMPGPGGHTP